MKENKYTIAWEEKYSTFMVDFFTQATIRHSNIVGNNLKEYYSFIVDTDRIVAYNSNSTQEILNKVHGSYFLEEKNINNLINNYQRLIREYSELYQKLTKREFHGLSNQNFSLLLKDFFDFFIEFTAYYRSSRPEAEIGPMQKMKSILYRHYTADKINNILQIITSNSKANIIDREKRDWLNLLTKDRILEKDITRHILKYPSFYTNIYSLREIILLLKKRIKNDKKRISKLSEEVRKNRNYYKNINARQKRIYSRCDNNENLMLYSRMMQEFGFYRFKLKNIWAGSELTFSSLFQELAKRLSTPLFNILNYYTISELQNLNPLNKLEIDKRKKCLALLVKDKRCRVLSGKNGLDIFKKCDPKVESLDVMKGVSGYEGVARGKVQIIYPAKEEDYKIFKKRNILVTTFTQPSMVPIMSKASAIVTCGGGVTSHCAIVSRELKIPSVINVKLATRILHDGDYIEVNGRTGVVRVLKRKK